MIIIDTESSEMTHTSSIAAVIYDVPKSYPINVKNMLMIGEVELTVSDPNNIDSTYNMVVYSGNIGVMTSRKNLTQLIFAVTQTPIDNLSEEIIVFTAMDTLINGDIDDSIVKSVYFRANSGLHNIIPSNRYKYRLYVAQMDTQANMNTILNDTCSFQCTSYLF